MKNKFFLFGYIKQLALLLLVTMTISACNDSKAPIEADDFGFPKVTVAAPGLNVTGEEDKQLSEWLDSGYKFNGDPIVIMVYNQGSDYTSSWTSWGCAGESALCQIAQIYPTCSLMQQCTTYSSSPPDGQVSKGKNSNGDNVYMELTSAPCNFTQGMGLYMLLTNYAAPVNNITDPNVYPNINRMPSSAGFFTTGLWNYTGMYQNSSLAKGYLDTTPSSINSNYIGGRAYFKILDRYYADNSGFFTASLKRGFTSIHNSPIASIINAVMVASDTAAEGLFKRIIANIEYVKSLKAMLVLYMIVQGILYTGGVIQMNHKELIYTFMRIVVVVQLLATQTSWDLFNNYFFKFFTGGLVQIIDIITSNISGSGASGLTFFDNIFNIFFSYETSMKILALLISFPCGFIVIGMIYCSIFLFAICLGKAVMLYLLSYLALSLLVVMGPIFLTFMLFGPTRELFESWLNQFANYFFQPVLVFAFLNVMGQTIINQFYYLLGFKVCYSNWIVTSTGTAIAKWWQICGFNSLQASIPVPGFGFWDTNNPGTFYAPYTFSATRYVDLPFLNLTTDSSLISAFRTPYTSLNAPMLFNALVLLVMCYLMYKFYDTVADIGKGIAGTASASNTGGGNALSGAASGIYNDIAHVGAQAKSLAASRAAGKANKAGGGRPRSSGATVDSMTMPPSSP